MASLAELLDIEVPTWRKEAVCIGMPVEVFFPSTADGERLDASGYVRARCICASCPVRLACLKECADERFGFWGSLSPVERHELRRQREMQLSARSQR